jgi:hypothetical protein
MNKAGPSPGTGLWSIALLAGALAVAAVAVFALFRGHTPAAVVVVAALALTGAAFTTSGHGFNDDWITDGVESCDSWADCGGPFLNPAVRELRRDALTTPEAQRSGYELDPGYAARPLTPWYVFGLIAHAIFLVAGFFAFRLNRVLLRAGPAVPFLAVVTLFWTASVVDCGDGGMSSSEGGLQTLAFYPLALGGLAGIAGVTTPQCKRIGWITIIVTIVLTRSSGSERFWSAVTTNRRSCTRASARRRG